MLYNILWSGPSSLLTYLVAVALFNRQRPELHLAICWRESSAWVDLRRDRREVEPY